MSSDDPLDLNHSRNVALKCKTPHKKCKTTTPNPNHSAIFIKFLNLEGSLLCKGPFTMS